MQGSNPEGPQTCDSISDIVTQALKNYPIIVKKTILAKLLEGMKCQTMKKHWI
jgi:hypothetical protein